MMDDDLRRWWVTHKSKGFYSVTESICDRSAIVDSINEICCMLVHILEVLRHVLSLGRCQSHVC